MKIKNWLVSIIIISINFNASGQYLKLDLGSTASISYIKGGDNTYKSDLHFVINNEYRDRMNIKEKFNSIYSWKVYGNLNYIFENGLLLKSGIGLRKLIYGRTVSYADYIVNVNTHAVRVRLIDYPTSNVNIYYIDIPLMLGYHYQSKNQSISGGVIASLLQNSNQGKYIVSYSDWWTSTLTTYSKNEGLQRVQYTLVVGLDWKIRRFIMLNINASRNLTSLYKTNYVISGRSILNSIEVGLCYTFY